MGTLKDVVELKQWLDNADLKKVKVFTDVGKRDDKVVELGITLAQFMDVNNFIEIASNTTKVYRLEYENKSFTVVGSGCNE